MRKKENSEYIFTKVIDQLFDNVPSAISATVLSVVVVGFFFWQQVPPENILVWFGCNFTAMGLRLMILFLFRRSSLCGMARYRRYYSAYLAVIGLSGSALGSCVYFLYTPSSPDYLAFIYFVLGGLLIGASASLAISARAFFMYAIPVYLPFTFVCMFRNGKMAVMGLILFFFISFINRKLKGVFIQNLLTVKKNMELLDLLSEEKKKLSHISQTDELTGLYNRRGFTNFAQQALTLALSMKKCGHLIYADLDDLKKINDRFGHGEGDKALVKAAEVLRKTFRDMDIIGRVGGDEFTILTVNTDAAFISVLQERLKQHSAIFNESNDKPYLINISFGAVQFSPNSSSDLECLLLQADDCLYTQKKKNKRNTQLAFEVKSD